METLILTAEHRNQYHGKRSSDGFRSAPSRTFRQLNCRTFHSGVGLLPRPKRTTSSSTHVTKRPLLPQPHSPPCVRTSPIPIATSSSSRGSQRRSLYYSELWAGPTYSNSPPPASVPMPKFSLRRNRTVSLSFPAPDPDVDIREAAKSAPVSPTTSCADNPFHSTVSATMNLRRMLNLENADDE
ncbi:hypothetical protein HA466_0204550 [Hirschfeldia incana]|nr:hypothetical protein HA466_0204550 [Hirschfeldia incana]